MWYNAELFRWINKQREVTKFSIQAVTVEPHYKEVGYNKTLITR